MAVPTLFSMGSLWRAHLVQRGCSHCSNQAGHECLSSPSAHFSPQLVYKILPWKLECPKQEFLLMNSSCCYGTELHLLVWEGVGVCVPSLS